MIQRTNPTISSTPTVEALHPYNRTVIRQTVRESIHTHRYLRHPARRKCKKITEHLNTTTTSVEFFKTSNAPYHLYILDTTITTLKEEHPSTTNTHHKGNEQGQPISCTYTHMRKQQSNTTSLTKGRKNSK